MNKILSLRQLCARHGFTLMELMVVAIVVGLIAAFAIPNYSKAVERAHEKDSFQALTLIAASNEAYKARYGEYWGVNPPVLTNSGIGVMNAGLNLQVVETGVRFYYSPNPVNVVAGGYRVLGYRSGKWSLYIDPDHQVPCCQPALGVCPTIADCAAPAIAPT
jgi:prepilin-type N-terminal cleavage/methylation domain-containing protein